VGQVLKSRKPLDLAGKALFVGRAFDIPPPNKMSGPNEAEFFDQLLIRGARTVYNIGNPDAFGFTTPLHVFWAQIAAMQKADRFVAVAGKTLTFVLLASLVAGIFLTIYFFGGELNLAMFTIYSLVIIVADILAVSFFDFYIPPFNIIYAGFLGFVTLGFFSISQSAYVKWRFMLYYQEGAHLKANFISLMSHNLNTSIAKMYGLLPLIQGKTLSDDATSDLGLISNWLGNLEQCIKSVLAASKLEEKILSPQPTTLRLFREEFLKESRGVLRKLGIECQIDLEETEETFLPVGIDHSALRIGLVSFVILVAKSTGGSVVNLYWTLTQDEDRFAFRCVNFTKARQDFDRLSLLLSYVQNMNLFELRDDFLTQISIKIINLLLACHGGALVLPTETAEIKELGFQLNLRLMG
jgi:signal transduction histidine kinase